MSDSIPNFSDLGSDMGDTTYTGLSDTGLDFSGSSTMQDVQLGSPLVLDTSYGSLPEGNGSSVTDMLSPNYDWLSSPTGTMSSQTLSGASETPPDVASATLSTPTPNVTQPNNNTWQAITALSKFGASFGSMFGGQPVVRQNVPAQYVTQAGAPLPPAAANGTSTLILVIVVGALIFLLLRTGEE